MYVFCDEMMPVRMDDMVLDFAMLLRRMQLGKDAAPFVIWREEHLFGSHPYPVKIDLPCLFVCLEGQMKLEINLRPYIFDKGHLLYFTTPCACRIVERAGGFRCVGVLFSKSYWRRLMFSEHTLGSVTARDAFVGITDDEWERIIRFHELLCLCADAPARGDRLDSLQPVVVGMLCQVCDICRDRAATAAPASHGEKILYDFLDLLHENYRSHKRVSFYADELSLTPRHLTTVIRQASGRSVSQWIEERVVLEAQILLRNSTMTIKEIAYGLGFDDQSLFSKYFSRVAGISPVLYRRQ